MNKLWEETHKIRGFFSGPTTKKGKVKPNKPLQKMSSSEKINGRNEPLVSREGYLDQMVRLLNITYFLCVLPLIVDVDSLQVDSIVIRSGQVCDLIHFFSDPYGVRLKFNEI